MDIGSAQFWVFTISQLLGSWPGKEKIVKKLLLILSLLSSVSSAQAQGTVVVSAAASMQNALKAIATDYGRQQPGTMVRFNFASSGTLQRQIENGAPVDVFISAARKNMDELQARGLILADTRRNLASNRLVLIVPRSSRVAVRSFADLKKPQVALVAIGAPQSVPVGRYAQELLQKIGIWHTVEKKSVRAKDVRGVLTQVELGNVTAGIVYRTDALISSKVRVISTAPENLHAPIVYPLAVVKASKNQTAARHFAAYLTSVPAQKVLQRFGFSVGN
jgi:molybdate transport system substrate-binding protein